MANEIKSRRVSWIALALSLLSAGVGHVYCGRIAKALPLYFAWLLVPICGIIAAMTKPSGVGLALILLPAIVVFALYIYAAMDAWLIANQIGSDYSLQDYNRPLVYWFLIVVQMVFSISLIAGTSQFVYEVFLIPTKSMSPTILPGDRILARKLLSQDYFPQRGDLVVYRNPTPDGATRFLGRVVAVAGDEVEVQGDRLIINGKTLARDRVPTENLKPFGAAAGQVSYEENSGHRYLVAYDEPKDEATAEENAAADNSKTKIAERHLFILGDNRDHARDSRQFGSIHSGDIVGCVDYVFWPSESWSRFGLANDRLP